jgi:hypothetical protein
MKQVLNSEKLSKTRKIPELHDGPPRFSLKEKKAILPHKGPKKVLYALMNEVELKVHHFQKECWNITIELIAEHLSLLSNPWKYSLPDSKWTGPVSKPSYSGFQQLKEHIGPTQLIESYIEQAKADPWDYLGDIFVEEELAGRANRLGQCLTPRGIVEMMTEMTLGTSVSQKKPYSYVKPDLSTRIWLTKEALAFNEKLAENSINLQAERARWHTVIGMRPLLVKYDPEPITNLDPAVGTGRFLIVASQMYPKAPLLLFGIEIDPCLYRACLVNMAMFSNHPYFIICADSLRLDPIMSAPMGPAWMVANQWNPPDMTPYYYKAPPPSPINAKSFSLKHFVNMKKP